MGARNDKWARKAGNGRSTSLKIKVNLNDAVAVSCF